MPAAGAPALAKALGIHLSALVRDAERLSGRSV
jgi:hypothetical protein